MVNKYAEKQQVELVPKKKLKTLAKISQDKVVLEQSIPNLIDKKVQEEVQKIDTMRRNESLRFRNIDRVNSQSDPDRKYNGDVPFSYMRRMAQLYPIARACINRRIRQITALEWDITTIDEKDQEKNDDPTIKVVKDFFKRPFGNKTRLRELLTMMVDDVLTVDATAFELQRTRGGEFLNLVQIDPTTIALRVTEQGATPTPPDIAYEQIIGGQKIAEFTTDELIYEFMGNRSYSPYGVSPLESLIIQVESALRGALYNLNYFKENNIPEGFITLPDDVVANKDRVEEWQMWFDSIMAGDARTIHRLKILPGGSEYTPAKKPEDMAFERFEMWLLQQTCMMFDVPPQDIGITYQVNRATGESQGNLGKEKGLLPLGNFIKEIFDDLIQVTMMMPDLQFMWVNINPVDRLQEVEVAEKEIQMGTLGVDEWRTEQGREPLGLDPYVMTSSGPLLVKDIVAGTVGPGADAKRADMIAAQPKPEPFGGGNKNEIDQSKKSKEDLEDDALEISDIRKWRKVIYNDIEFGKELRLYFPSQYIRPEVHKEIEEKLKYVSTKEQAKIVFEEYLDPDIRASMILLGHASNLRKLENHASS